MQMEQFHAKSINNFSTIHMQLYYTKKKLNKFSTRKKQLFTLLLNCQFRRLLVYCNRIIDLSVPK